MGARARSGAAEGARRGLAGSCQHLQRAASLEAQQRGSSWQRAGEAERTCCGCWIRKQASDCGQARCALRRWLRMILVSSCASRAAPHSFNHGRCPAHPRNSLTSRPAARPQRWHSNRHHVCCLCSSGSSSAAAQAACGWCRRRRCTRSSSSSSRACVGCADRAARPCAHEPLGAAVAPDAS